MGIKKIVLGLGRIPKSVVHWVTVRWRLPARQPAILRAATSAPTTRRSDKRALQSDLANGLPKDRIRDVDLTTVKRFKNVRQPAIQIAAVTTKMMTTPAWIIQTTSSRAETTKTDWVGKQPEKRCDLNDSE